MAEIVPIKRHKAFYRDRRASIGRTLRQAKDMGLTEILVIGVDADGDVQVQGYPPDPGNAFWLMAMAGKKLTGGNS